METTQRGMGEHSEGSIVFSKRQSKPSKPLTTITPPLALPPTQHLYLGGHDALLRHRPAGRRRPRAAS